MAKITRDDVEVRLLEMLKQLGEDWEYEGEITLETWLVKDLELESLDVVVLTTTIQNHYDATIPFAEFMSEIGHREVRDIRLDELVEFVCHHTNSAHGT
jgi:acyl carrier protein